MGERTEADLALGLMRNAEALVSVMDSLADEVEAYGSLIVDERTVWRLSKLLSERGRLRATMRAARAISEHF